MSSLIIHCTLVAFMIFVYHDIPLEWQGFTGYIVGVTVTWNVIRAKKIREKRQ
ncbi:hypothetical protein KQH90_02015 [Anaerosalibacter bizertensis]|uniref:hypothetical protein n=1 Tax=Anaerosalibacter bizertensis TaxID=932217 RepID=UPI001C0EB246|nr:hypothetical protein [Anaerosalibacter bizertensis]MBU5292813.1 hypothetical protein [Anaerosalibacter bizertensis]